MWDLPEITSNYLRRWRTMQWMNLWHQQRTSKSNFPFCKTAATSCAVKTAGAGNASNDHMGWIRMQHAVERITHSLSSLPRSLYVKQTTITKLCAMDKTCKCLAGVKPVGGEEMEKGHHPLRKIVRDLAPGSPSLLIAEEDCHSLRLLWAWAWDGFLGPHESGPPNTDNLSSSA